MSEHDRGGGVIAGDGTQSACPRCGEGLPSIARYCPACGGAMDAGSEPDTTGFGEVTLAERAMRPAHVAGERRVVTFLFADVVGSTGIAERMDPEEWAAIMNEAFERLSPAIHAYGGTIIDLMGDGLLAFFGAPLAHEDDPARAVAAALDLIAAARDYAAPLREARGIEFRVRVGVNTGPVVLGDVGSGIKFQYGAMGDAVNVAARLQAAARPMTALIAAETHQRLAGAFDCTDRGAIRVKGKAEPVRVYEVRGRARPAGTTSGDTETTSASRSIRAALVGREIELDALRMAVERLASGRGGVVTVVGEAGVGKTRLIAEARGHAADPAPLWLAGHALSFGRSISYAPFLEMLRGCLAIGPDDSEAEAFARAESRVVDLFPDDADEILPYLATLLGLKVPDRLAARVKYLDGEAMRRQTFRSTWRLVERLARERPLVLVFEDLHWLDQSSADLLEHLLPLTRAVPLVILCASRPDPHASEAALARVRRFGAEEGDGRAVEVALAPLTSAESERLVGDLLAADPRSTRLGAAIREKAEGNPFFVEEVMRSLIEVRAVAWDDAAGRWRALADGDDLRIPDTVQAVIAARLDRLDDGAKAVLRTAAVIGRDFPYRVLRAVAAADARLDPHLRELQRLEFVRVRQREPELEFTFTHALAQQAIYESILVRRRRELHGRVAAAIEAVYAGRREEAYALLAYHYARAESWEKAQAYLLDAGDQAGRLAADAEALEHYAQATRIYEAATVARPDRLRWASVKRRIGEALFRRGDHPAAQTYLERALDELGTAMPRSRWQIRAIIARELGRQIVRSYAAVGDAPAPPPVVEPAIAETLDIYRSLIWIYLWCDRERFLTSILLALRRCEDAGDLGGEAQALCGLGLACNERGQFRLSARVLRRAMALAERTGDPLARANALGALGHYYEVTCQYAPAFDYYGRSGLAYRAIGDLQAWGSTEWGRCLAACLSGAERRAAALARAMVRLGEQAGDVQVQGWGWQCLGMALTALGELEEAEAALERARTILAGARSYLALAFTLGHLGQCRLRAGDLDGAVSVLEAGVRHITDHQIAGNNTIAIRTGLAEAYLRRAEGLAGDARRQALRVARDACKAALSACRIHRQGLPAAYRHQGTLAWLQGKPSAARRWWRRSLDIAMQQDVPREQVRTHLAIGMRLADTAALARAAALDAEIEARDAAATGAPPDETPAAIA